MPDPAPTEIVLTAGATAEGRRLDHVLTEISGLTRTQVQRLIRSGHVRVDGNVPKAGLALRAGNRVVMIVPTPAPTDIEPEPIPLDIVFEDEWMLVVNKPPGLVVHPGAGVSRGTLVHGLVHHCPEIEGVGGVRRPGIVHRLDKDTSGLLLVAKTHSVYLALAEALRERRIRRRYIAIVWGHLGGAGFIDAPIGRDPHARKRMAIRETGGKAARTEFREKERFDFVSSVELTLQTGRTHQIRVHLAFKGHPVFGDPVYGGRVRPLARLALGSRRRAHRLLTIMRRQALHAERLEFDHPITGRSMRLECAPPDDFSRLVEALRGERPD